MDSCAWRKDRIILHAIYGCCMGLQRMIRKDGFKLIVYPEADKTLLFDVEDDPLEMNDLSDDPDYQDIKAGLFSDLLTLKKEMNDELVLDFHVK